MHGCIDYIIADTNVSIFTDYANDQKGNYLHIDHEWSIKCVLIKFLLVTNSTVQNYATDDESLIFVTIS